MKHLKIICLLLALLLLVACGGGTAPTIVAVGQTVTLYSVQATVTGVGTLYYDAPPDGQPAEIAVHVKLVNAGTSEIVYSPFMFHLKSGAGTITGHQLLPPLAYQSNNVLGSGHLVPPGTVEGDLIFQITMGDHQATVTWQPTATDSDSANGWILGL